MGINILENITPELHTSSNSVWAPICDLAFDANTNQTFTATFTIWARKTDGTSAAWDGFYVFERTDNTNRILTNNIINVLTPVKDLGALLWDIRIVVSGTSFQLQCKGGTTTDQVAWYVRGDLLGIYYP